MKSGYSHPGYAEALSEFGRPRALPASGGWILERSIPGTDAADAMGCYPIFSCRDWEQLEGDLNQIGTALVSLVVVADPFGDFAEELLARTFSDLVVRYKEHFISDLQAAPRSFVSRHHRYYAEKALRKVTVERCADPAQMADEWTALYASLVARWQLRGIQAFSRASFAKQLRIPGLVMLRAQHDGKTVGAHLWYTQGEVAYSHLTCSSALGYELMAAYALCWSALEYFTGKVRWLDWGAGAGAGAGSDGSADGLSRFKRGWANGIRPAYLCGRIFDRARYDELARTRNRSGTGYFPAYRENEFR